MQLLAAYAWASDGHMRGCSLVELLCTRQKIPYMPHIEEKIPQCCSLSSFSLATALISAIHYCYD